ncbi:MAG: hypothetical protein JST00_05860 [Deltaproteobacteria bacterium]|nr:hypothetical protein [Deltaproteobacteria bacterium]
MRSLKTGLTAAIITGFALTAAIVGCSADGGSTLITDPSPAQPEEPGAVLPPQNQTPDNGVDSGTTDSGKKDSGSKDSGTADADAGPPPPTPGTACTKDSEQKERDCGACGKQKTVCLNDGSGLKWSEYGVCENELVGGCIPGTVVDEPCGNCGTMKKTCTKYCAYTSSSCTGQPAVNCKPGTKEYLTAGCPTAGTYRDRTCGNACTWGSTSATCQAPVNDNVLTIAAAASGTVVGSYTLSTAKVGKRVTGSCPNATVSTTGDYTYELVEIKNPTAQTAKVSAWLEGTPAIDTVMQAYNTNLPPQDDTALKACAWGTNDFCPSSLPCSADDDWSGLTGTQQITIAPGRSVLIRFGAYYAQGGTQVTTGGATLTVRTDSLM